MDGYAAEVIDKMIQPRHVAHMAEVTEHVLGMMHGTAPAGAAATLRGRAERPDVGDRWTLPPWESPP